MSAANIESVLVIGAGKMGEAIVAGWLGAEEGPAAALGPASFLLVEPGEERRSYLEQTHGVDTVADVSEAPDFYRARGTVAPDLILLAVKPQVMMGVLDDLRATGWLEGADGAAMPLFASIAAGLTTDRLEAALPKGAHLVRLMPNTPLQVGAGATGVCGGAAATDDETALVRELFASLGVAVVVDESLMDAVGALSGSGPAYVAYLVETLRDAAAEEGLDPELAQALALQTVLGTAQMLAETGQDPAQARIAVCSPGGSTLAALEAMDAAGFRKVFFDGVSAAVKRNKELAQC